MEGVEGFEPSQDSCLCKPTFTPNLSLLYKKHHVENSTSAIGTVWSFFSIDSLAKRAHLKRRDYFLAHIFLLELSFPVKRLFS